MFQVIKMRNERPLQKLIIKLTLSAFLLTTILPPISNAELTPAQQKAYTHQRLSIELGESTYVNPKTGWGSTSKHWRAYQGFNLITEEEFFKITGYTAEEEKSKERKRLAAAYQGYTIASFIIATGFVLGAASTLQTETGTVYQGYSMRIVEHKKILTDGGKVLLGIGLTGYYIGLFLGLEAASYCQNWASYATVEPIAEEFNLNLHKKF